MHILIADDDPATANMIAFVLEVAGYTVSKAQDSAQALQTFREQQPGLLLLSPALTPIGGFELCQRIRCSSDVPLIFLSASDDVRERVVGLQIGADDYLVKPVEPVELLCRIEAVLRRCTGAAQPALAPLRLADMLLVPIAHAVVLPDDRTITLTPLEFQLLYYLMTNAGQVLSAAQIRQEIWGDAGATEGSLLATYIGRLRAKLESQPGRPRHILTVHRVGYTFEA